MEDWTGLKPATIDTGSLLVFFQVWIRWPLGLANDHVRNADTVASSRSFQWIQVFALGKSRLIEPGRLLTAIGVAKPMQQTPNCTAKQQLSAKFPPVIHCSRESKGSTQTQEEENKAK